MRDVSFCKDMTKNMKSRKRREKAEIEELKRLIKKEFLKHKKQRSN